MEDRRIRRTRKAIFAALQELSETRPIASITISELARTANITRKTFYDHYPNVTSAYQAMIDEVVSDVAQKTEQDWQLCTKARIECSPDEETETRLMLFLGNVREVIEGHPTSSRRRNRYITQEEEMGYLSKPFARHVRDGLFGQPSRFKGNEDLVTEFALVGMLWMYRKWIAGEDRTSFLDIQSRACKLIMGGLSAI